MSASESRPDGESQAASTTIPLVPTIVPDRLVHVSVAVREVVAQLVEEAGR